MASQSAGGPIPAAAVRAVEEAAIAAWPAAETAAVDGWLWRSSGGGSQRANSVATLDFEGDAGQLDRAIEEVERRYAARGGLSRFQICDMTVPAALDERLAARGYACQEPCTTMIKPVGAAVAPVEAHVAETADEAWLSVYLPAITPSRREVNQAILPRVPRPRAFVTCRRQGLAIGCGLGVVHGPAAVIECMATLESARRQGAARAVLDAIEAWARTQGASWLGLQAVAANTPAIRLYESHGFRHAARYHYRVRVLAR